MTENLPERPTHILIITADQMRADTMGCAPNPAAITPTLDRLAAGGTVFDRAYCVNPVCTPSRAAILTGRYPHCTGAWNIGVSVDEEEITLPDHLKPLGYRSVANGKMHFRPQCIRTPDASDVAPEDPAVRDRPRQRDGTYYGFEELHNTEDNKVGEYLDWLREQDPQWANPPHRHLTNPDCTRLGSQLPPELHQTHWVADRSLETIAAHDPARPLLMWTSFVDPHHPFDAPRKYVRMYDGVELPGPSGSREKHAMRPEDLRRQGERGYWPGGGQEHDHSPEKMKEIIRNYYAMVTFIDEQIGRLVDALAGRGMLDDTLIVFTADHGELLGDHGLMMKGPWLEESLIRVPMILAGPGVPTGRTDALMENVDILPTLLELIGRPIPYGVQGRSQVPVLTGQARSVRDSIVCSYDAHDRGIHAKCLRTDRHKLTVFAGEEYGELYDLAEDPTEDRNRYDDPSMAQVRAQMFQHFTHRLIADADPLPQRLSPW